MRFPIAILTMLFTFATFAATPYPPEINKRFKALEAVTDLATPTTNGLQKMKVARVAFDSTTQGTSSATAYSLGVTLPANSLIWDGVIYTTSGFSGTGSVALECEDSKNIKGDTQVSTLGTTGTKTALLATGTAASAISSIASACAISARISNANVVGKFDAWILYFVTD